MPKTPDYCKEALPPIEAYEIIGDQLVVPQDYTVTQECLKSIHCAEDNEVAKS